MRVTNLAVLRWILLAVAVTLATPVQAIADTPPIVRLRSSKAKAPAKAVKKVVKKTARARKGKGKGKRARKPAVAKRSAKQQKSKKQRRERAAVIRPMP